MNNPTPPPAAPVISTPAEPAPADASGTAAADAPPEGSGPRAETAESEVAEETWPATTASPRFPVVGIGGDLGVKDALIELLDGMSAGLGMAFVFVPGRSDEPDEGLMPAKLAATLSAHTAMPIVEVLVPTRIEPDHLYLLTPGTCVEIRDWTLIPSPVPGPGPGQPELFPPIDGLLGALARGIDSCAIGVLLSGTGTDGATGLREIKGVGGITTPRIPIAPHIRSCRGPRSPAVRSTSCCRRRASPTSCSASASTPSCASPRARPATTS